MCHQQSPECLSTEDADSVLLLEPVAEIVNLLVDDAVFCIVVLKEIEDKYVVFTDSVENLGSTEPVHEEILHFIAKMLAKLLVGKLCKSRVALLHAEDSCRLGFGQASPS